MEKARQRLAPAKRNCSLIRTTTTFWIHRTGTGGEHVSQYADGPEDPDGADLRNLLTYLREDAPQVVSGVMRFSHCRHKSMKNKAKSLATGWQAKPYGGGFWRNQIKREFNTELYKLTLTSIEKTRVERLVSSRCCQWSVRHSCRRNVFSKYPLFDRLLVTGVLPAVGTLKLLLAVIEDHRD